MGDNHSIVFFADWNSNGKSQFPPMFLRFDEKRTTTTTTNQDAESEHGRQFSKRATTNKTTNMCRHGNHNSDF